jgi:fluoroacetyl-CoA thioesterase
LKETLRAGLSYTHRYTVPETKTVPALLPESPEFQAMPAVLATGYLVGLLEWTCILAINPHLDWPAEQTLGTHIDVSHAAATPPGLVVTIEARLVRVEGRRLYFEVEASDGVDVIGRGRHERAVIDRARFDERVARKRVGAGR